MNRFRQMLASPAKDRPVLDAAMSTSETVIDVLMKDEVVAAIPVFGIALKTVKALDSIRDQMFAAKLHQFIVQAEIMSKEDRLATAQKLMADEEGRKTAETLLMVLDRITDLDKPALLGVLFIHFGAGRLTTSEFRRLATAIDAAFSDDLATFLNEPAITLDSDRMASHRESLLSAGLTRALPVNDLYNLGLVNYRVTPSGKLLHTLVNTKVIADPEPMS
ncbi:MAG: hypothetical protein ACK4F4_06560 [Hylemonella sp.]|uniref:hypothetical protein n=1 Tax=Hylemonella sp. TaxID=2066020 RepID=UPI00391CE6B7